MISVDMSDEADGTSVAKPKTLPGEALPPLVIATALREEGITGVHTHVRQLRRYLDGCDAPAMLVTPFSWGWPLTAPVFAFRRLVLERCSRAASVAWYRHW